MPKLFPLIPKNEIGLGYTKLFAVIVILCYNHI